MGLPRSGKTYTAVSQQILPALRQGRLVVTNVPMKRDVVVRDIPDAENLLREFPMAAVVAAPDSIWEHCPNGALVVLDEVWRFWPAGKKVDKIPEAWKSFLAEHGHRVDAAGTLCRSCSSRRTSRRSQLSRGSWSSRHFARLSSARLVSTRNSALIFTAGRFRA